MHSVSEPPKLNVEPLETSSSLRMLAYDALKRAITEMDIYGSNAEFRLDERQLSEDLGVSRTPIRAALQKLESEGLLDAMPNGRGYRLRQFSKADIWDAIEIHATMEGLAARMAAERGVDELLMEQARELLAGIAGCILLALVLDIAIRLLERALTPWRRAREGSAA